MITGVVKVLCIIECCVFVVHIILHFLHHLHHIVRHHNRVGSGQCTSNNQLPWWGTVYDLNATFIENWCNQEPLCMGYDGVGGEDMIVDNVYCSGYVPQYCVYGLLCTGTYQFLSINSCREETSYYSSIKTQTLTEFQQDCSRRPRCLGFTYVNGTGYFHCNNYDGLLCPRYTHL